jgi:hypothetical protein
MTIRDVIVERGILTPEKADEVLDARAMTEGGIRAPDGVTGKPNKQSEG